MVLECIELLGQHLASFLEYENLENEVLQTLREIGNTTLIIHMIERTIVSLYTHI